MRIRCRRATRWSSNGFEIRSGRREIARPFSEEDDSLARSCRPRPSERESPRVMNRGPYSTEQLIALHAFFAEAAAAGEAA
ncbi:hypothetical protein K2X89_12255, partial [Myxococcota bacterium]|nr:hypothetical protein [Myxococcota bacterium]